MEQSLKILDIESISKNVKVFCFTSETDLVDYSPGSFIDIQTPHGWRSYSLLSEKCINNTYKIAVKKEDNGKKGSLWMHNDVYINDVLLSRKPKNNFNLKENLNQNVFIAGGIGLTPLISLFYNYKNKKQSFYYSYGKESDEFLFDRLIDYDLNEDFILKKFSTKKEKRHLDFTKLVDIYGLNANYFCCGPSEMIESFKKEMIVRGVENYFFEHFFAERKELDKTKYENNVEHSVYLSKSQKMVMMSANEYLLDALKREGVAVAYSCESGICGTCEARILKGQVDHNDHILSDAEKAKGETVMLCTARPFSRELILDL